MLLMDTVEGNLKKSAFGLNESIKAAEGKIQNSPTQCACICAGQILTTALKMYVKGRQDRRIFQGYLFAELSVALTSDGAKYGD